MLTSDALFYVFSSLLLFCSVMVILVKHPVLSLLFLVSSFIFAAFILLLFECEFLAFMLVTLYAGAVAILFLFVIMMLEAKLPNLSRDVVKHLPAGLFFTTMFFVPLLFEIDSPFNTGATYQNSFYFNRVENYYALADSLNDIEVYGELLYDYFVLHFLIAGLLLLVVLISVISLTNNYNLNNRRLDQTAIKQLARRGSKFS